MRLISSFRRGAHNSWLAFLIPVAMVVFGRALLLGIVPPPQPQIVDEFANLLAADTFSSGRLTNPTHPKWVHFETFHILSVPTYMSKYPPFQGMLLAIGQLLFGIPWIAVWLSMAVFCGLLPWAFRGWLSPGWALLGGILGTLKIGIMSYWTESFWGGSVAAIGGLLLLGSSFRIEKKPSKRLGFLFALGIGVLANSRPFEGLVLTICCLMYLARKLCFGNRWEELRGVVFRQVVPVVILVLFLFGCWMAYYNYRGTGDPLLPPYIEYERQYPVWSMFSWQTEPKPTPTYRHEIMHRYWVECDGSDKIFQRKNWLLIHLKNTLEVISFYFGYTFYLGGFFLVLCLIRHRKSRPLLWLFLVFYAGIRILCYITPHYTAPIATLLYLALTAGLRILWHWHPGNLPWLRFAGRGAALCLCSIFFWNTAKTLVSEENKFLFDETEFAARRGKVISLLNRKPGQHLVLTRYGTKHDINHEWVYNQADIDAQRIVWARDMKPEENTELFSYYPERKPWLLEDDGTLILRPYDSPHERPLIIFSTKNR